MAPCLVTKAQGWAYRNWDEAPKRNLQGALAIHTLVWWWIFHGTLTDTLDYNAILNTVPEAGSSP